MKEKLEELKIKLAESSTLINELTKGGVVITITIDNGVQSRGSILKGDTTSIITVTSATLQTEL